jgi:hypothetical protein
VSDKDGEMGGATDGVPLLSMTALAGEDDAFLPARGLSPVRQRFRPGDIPWSSEEHIPSDPYNKEKTSYAVQCRYRYATNGLDCWILMSYGPDLDEDMRIQDFVDPQKGNCDVHRFLSQYGQGTAVIYDTTNGTTSSGDIIKTGQQ